MLSDRFGFSGELPGFFSKNMKDRLFYSAPSMTRAPLDALRTNSCGLYFGYLDDDLRLSIEGSQMIGASCTKNVLEISDEDANRWLSGENLDIPYPEKGPVILRNGPDFIGCGKSNGVIIFNFVPKARRVH